MTPTTTTFPIDAPPAPPNEASYGLLALAIYPAQVTSATFDPTKPSKSWTRPLQPGEDPNSWLIYSFYSASGVFMPNNGAITRGAAAEPVNIAPAATTPAQQQALMGSAYYTLPAVPIPARALVAGESIVPMPTGPMVLNANFVLPAQPQTPQQNTDSATLQRVLTGVNALLKNAGLPAV